MKLYEIWGRNGRGPCGMYTHLFRAETERAAVEGYQQERRAVITATLHIQRADSRSCHQWRFDEQGLAHRVS